jgi:hypothetical protein
MFILDPTWNAAASANGAILQAAAQLLILPRITAISP